MPAFVVEGVHVSTDEVPNKSSGMKFVIPLQHQSNRSVACNARIYVRRGIIAYVCCYASNRFVWQKPALLRRPINSFPASEFTS